MADNGRRPVAERCPKDVGEVSSDAQSNEVEPAVRLALENSVWDVVDSDSVDIVGSTEPGAVISATWDSGNSSTTADTSGAFRVRVAPLTRIGDNRVEVRAALKKREAFFN